MCVLFGHTFQYLTNLDRQGVQIIQTVQQVVCCSFSWLPFFPLQQHFQLLHAHTVFRNLEVIHIFSLYAQKDGHLLPLFSKLTGDLQELLLWQVLTLSLPCFHSIWKKKKKRNKKKAIYFNLRCFGYARFTQCNCLKLKLVFIAVRLSDWLSDKGGKV